jgi:hypothetical protein
MADYLVVFAKDPVDDALADRILARVRALGGVGWFDDPGAATPAERTTGGYVRTDDPDAPDAAALVDAACALSSEHGCAFEVQFREQPIAHIAEGERRDRS